MRLNGAAIVVAAAAAAATAEDSAADEALVVEAAESVELLCPAESACQLEMGVAFGDPWVKAEAGDIGYFEVGANSQIYVSAACTC